MLTALRTVNSVMVVSGVFGRKNTQGMSGHVCGATTAARGTEAYPVRQPTMCYVRLQR